MHIVGRYSIYSLCITAYFSRYCSWVRVCLFVEYKFIALIISYLLINVNFCAGENKRSWRLKDNHPG